MRGNRQSALMAGLTVATPGVREGMAAALLASIHPPYGLDACLLGPIAGSLFTSTRLMVLTRASANATVAGHPVRSVSRDRERAVFYMVMLSTVAKSMRIDCPPHRPTSPPS